MFLTCLVDLLALLLLSAISLNPSLSSLGSGRTGDISQSS